MLVRFFLLLRSAGVPASITELMTLLEALKRGLGETSAERFYHLARTCLVKDERYYDRFDRVFAAHFKGAEEVVRRLSRELPADWLEKLLVRISPTPRRPRIEALGGWDRLMETLKKRLEEQQERHQGGNKWIGTAGTSPFGAYGYNPEGVRIGQHASRNRSAVKVWDRSEFANSRRLGGARHAQHEARAAQVCGALRGAARPPSSRSPRPSTPPRARAAGSTSRWCRSGTTS